MSSEAIRIPSFTGPYASWLEKFATLMDKLWQEHRTSPTLAGKEEFYAWGNIDYAVVMSGHKFDDLVDVKTKFGSLEIKKDSSGNLVCEIVEDKPLHRKEKATNLSKDPAEILERTIAALTKYYYSSI